jgi:DNA-binding CsgD family transcriptional regulator
MAAAEGDTTLAVVLSEDAYRNLRFPAPAMTTPADFSDDVQLARVSIAGGVPERLEAIIDVVDARAASNPGNPLAVGVAHHVAGLAGRGVERLESAVDAFRQCARPLVLANALEDLGVARAAAGRTGAEAAWAEAVDLYEASGATRDAGRALRRLRTIGVRRRPRPPIGHAGALSAREREVATRLASGSTTREIALDLYLSQNTVVTHIRHIYSKWGISTRKALVERARELRLTP